MLIKIAKLFLIFVSLFILVLCLQWSLSSPEQIAGTQVFEQLDFKFESDGENSYKTVNLPHNWDRSEPNKSGIGVYRAKLVLPEIPKEAIGFYLPKVSMNAEILLNGTSIGSGGSMKDPVARYWNLPLYLVLPTGLWNEGENIVKIRVYGFPNGRSGLGKIFVGRNEILSPIVENYRLKILLLDIGTFSINFILGLMLLAWAKRTREISLLYFAIGALLSCITIADSFWIEVPLNRFEWRWITHTSMSFSVIFFYLFMLKILNKKLGLVEKLGISYLFLGSISLLFADQGQLLPWAKWIHLGSLLIIIQLIYLCSKSWYQTENKMHLWLGACMSLVFIFGFIDWYPTLMNIPKNSPYLYYVGPVAFSFAVSIGLLFRYVNAQEIESNYSKILQKSLNQQQQSLDKQHEKILTFENERVIHEERNRIIRELHDGIGGQLMGALALSENKNDMIEKQVRYALDELRVIMDSLDPDSDFLTMLGMFRRRIEKDLLKNEIKLIWKVDSTPEALIKSPEKSLEAMRIVQEAIANIIKYANASEIIIIVSRTSIAVSDNGTGIMKNHKIGRGIKNMKWRSQKLNAEFVLNSSKSGTAINILW